MMHTADMMDKKGYAANGMFLGLVVGLAAGLLLAPQSGRESRSKLQNKMQDLKDKARDKAQQEKVMMADKAGSAADALRNVADKSEELAAKGRNRNTPAM